MSQTEPVPRLHKSPVVSREEIEARFDAAAAHNELKHQHVHAKMDLVLERLSHITSMIPDMHAHVSKLRDEVKDDYRNTRWTIAGVVVATMLACVGALSVTQADLMTALTLVKP